jgi:hypothetical protein
MKLSSRHLFACAVSIALANIIVILPNQAAYAQYRNPCPDYPPTQASESSRVIRIKKFNLEFKIPSNYKTISNGNGDNLYIGIYDPSSFKKIDCMMKNKIGTDDSYSLTTIHIKALEKQKDLARVTKEIHGSGTMQGIWDVENFTVNGRKAIKYKHHHLSLTNIGVSFLDPDGMTFVRVSHSPSDESAKVSSKRISNQVINSLRFSP